ncbi:hypothetical protein GCM10009574_077550 [Streptomyces asiaticus]|uniref:Bacterial transcriptional activator domain-containing protein n=2 Tax=Streptomyces rhizosphaericus TaxID=114699 RepID=A0ABP4CXJ8_9ACTN
MSDVSAVSAVSVADGRLLSAQAGVAGSPREPHDAAGGGLRFAVLGPVRIWRGERKLAALSDAVWGDVPPPEVIAGLRTYAFRLRRKLGPGVLVSEAGGYALRAGSKALDLEVCEGYEARAKRARAEGDPSEARRLLHMALVLWDGQALAGVPGRLRERLRIMLMLALCRSGRQAEALGVYTDTRRLLADELGVDPDSGLAQMHQRILRADPTLTLQARPSDAEAPHISVPRPAQLPAAMAVSAVRGLGGAGKTALAVHVAHSVRESFPDGQLFVDLLGQRSRPADPAAVLGVFLRALGTPSADLPEGLHERAALYRSVLADRRVLVLLDNAHDTTQVRPCCPVPPVAPP